MTKRSRVSKNTIQRVNSRKNVRYRLKIRLGEGYSIYIKSGLLDDKFLYNNIRDISNFCVVIADTNVAKIYANKVLKNLSRFKIQSTLITFPAGEIYKNRAQKNRIENEMLSRGLGRDICILALGGGVTTDLAGFIAATFNRGVPLIYCPTSLEAMADASLGGKTAVNTKWGKNLIGSFYHPNGIFIDTKTLNTLPEKEFKNALVEIVVHGLIADNNLFSFLETGLENIFRLDEALLERLIKVNCKIKKDIVEKDEKDKEFRKVLNFGHTIGHALELCSKYKINHGEAVAIGTIGEAYISVSLGLLSKQEFSRINHLFNSIGILPNLSKSITIDKLLNAMRLDKKAFRGIPRFILLEKIGKTVNLKNQVAFAVPKKVIISALKYVLCRE